VPYDREDEGLHLSPVPETVTAPQPHAHLLLPLQVARNATSKVRPEGTLLFMGGIGSRRIVGPADIAALAIHLMTNTAVTGATFDIDGGQQLV